MISAAERGAHLSILRSSICNCRRASCSILSILGTIHSVLCLDIRSIRRLGCLRLPRSAVLCFGACLWGWQGQQLFSTNAKALRQEAGVFLGLVHLRAHVRRVDPWSKDY